MSIRIYNHGTDTWNTQDGIFSGAPTTWRANGTLDSAVRVFVNSDKNPVKKLSLVELESGDQMVAVGDEVVQYNKRTNEYKHTLSLAEPTKILEYIKVHNFVSTNLEIGADKHYWYQLQRFCDNVNNLNYPLATLGDEVFYKLNPLSTTIGAKLGDKLGEEIVMSKSTAREILDEFMSAVDCRITVDNIQVDNGNMVLNLSYIDLNERIPSTITDIIGEERSNNAEDYAGSIWATAENAIIPNCVRQIDSFKTKYDESTMTDTNRIISLAYPIEYPTKFFINTTGQVTASYTSFGGGNHTFYPDLTGDYVDALDNFVDIEYYNTLASTAIRNKHICYQRGATEIDVSRTYKKILITISSFNEVLLDVYERHIRENWHIFCPEQGATFNGVSAVAGTYDNTIFDITYQPRLDCLLIVAKDEASELDSGLCVNDSQTDNIIDIERYGNNLYGKIQRLGNDELYIDCKLYDYDDIKPLFTEIEVDGDKYVVYEVSFADYTTAGGGHLYQVRYSLAKGYNNLAAKIGLRKEKRIYAIPLEGYKTICPVRSFLYIKKGTDAGTSVSTLPDVLVKSLASSKTNSNIPRGTSRGVENAQVTVSYETATNKNFLLPAAAFGAGKLICFTTSFYDHVSAGLSVDRSAAKHIFDWIGGKKVSYNPYVDDNGEARSFNVRFGYVTNARTATGVSAQPLWSGAEQFTTTAENTVRYHKDRAEGITIQRTTQIIEGDGIVATSRLTARNIATLGQDADSLYVWLPPNGFEGYKQGDKKCVGTRTATVGQYLTANATGYGFAFAAPVNTAVTYGIGDIDGNLYLGVNDSYNGQVCLYETTIKE